MSHWLKKTSCRFCVMWLYPQLTSGFGQLFVLNTRNNKKVTNPMEQEPSWESNKFSDKQESRYFLWNKKVHYRIHNSPPHIATLSHINTVHSPQTKCWLSYLILYSPVRLCAPSGDFSSGFPDQKSCKNLSCTLYLLHSSSWLYHPHSM